MPPIKVQVVDRGEKGFYFRWRDSTGRRREEAVKDEDGENVFSERLACELIEQQRAKLKRRLSGDGSILWEEWRVNVREDYYPSLADNSVKSTDGILNCIERTVKPSALADITTQALTKHAREYRKLGRSENTIASHFAAIQAVLNWSIDQGYLTELPKIPRVPRATGERSRGRPLTDSEFEAMLQAVPQVVPESAVDSWRHFLNGLWFSGLRLSEGIKLTWHPTEAGFWIDSPDTDRPKLAIRSKSEKGKKNRLLPLTPDFAEFLRKDQSPRVGNVFKPLVRYDRNTSSRDQCTHVISAIGEASKVITEEGRHPTAHDLRRSFGLRWAMMVQPAVLQQLMRHASIQTTLTYYARADADRWGDEVYDAWKSRKSRVNKRVNPKKRDS